MALTKEQLEAALAVKPKLVEIPGLGEIYLRPLSGDARDWLDGRMSQAKNNPALYVGIRREVVGKSVCDERGELLYTPAEYPHIGGGNGQLLDAIFQRCQEVSGLLGDEAVDAAAKNS